MEKIERLLPMISLKWAGSCYEHIDFPGEITKFAANLQNNQQIPTQQNLR